MKAFSLTWNWSSPLTPPYILICTMKLLMLSEWLLLILWPLPLLPPLKSGLILNILEYNMKEMAMFIPKKMMLTPQTFKPMFLLCNGVKSITMTTLSLFSITWLFNLTNSLNLKLSSLLTKLDLWQVLIYKEDQELDLNSAKLLMFLDNTLIALLLYTMLPLKKFLLTSLHRLQ